MALGKFERPLKWFDLFDRIDYTSKFVHVIFVPRI